MENNNKVPVSVEKKEDSIDLRYVVDVLWSLKYWIIASVFVLMLAGNVYIRMTTPEYTRTATVLIANDRMTGGMGADLQILSDITGMRANGIVQNEIYILKSRPLMQEVVEDLSLNTRYYRTDGLFRDIEMYKTSPFSFQLISGSETNKFPSISVEFEVGEDTLSYTVRKMSFVSSAADAEHPVLKEFKGKEYNFGDAVELPDNNVIIIAKSDSDRTMEPGGRYMVSFSSPEKMAKYYSSILSASTTDYRERSSVISMSIRDNIPARADDILNDLITQYNMDTREFMSLSTSNTLNFIDERLAGLETQLGNIEAEVRNYKTDNYLVDFALQSQSMIQKGSEYDKEIAQIGVQQQLLDMIKEYFKVNDFNLLPTNIGIEDSGLSSLITQYNTMVMERRGLLLGASESNPRVQALTNQIQDMRNAVNLTINQLKDAYKLRYDMLVKEAESDRAKMSGIPTQQLDLAQIERQQKIVEPLYVLLRQKKEEALISLYAQTDNARIVEPADGPDTPSSPQPMMIYVFCFIMGLIIPPGTFFVGNLLKRKVTSIKDVQDRTALPIVGYIPVSDSMTVAQGSRDAMTESFRAVRANLGFLSGSVFQVTSSISGEGKSTVAVNTALTLAFAGKKVLFIETDLRNGFDYKFFNLPKSSTGLSTYLSGSSGLDDVLVRGAVQENLDVILKGSVPPNPNELLSSRKMADLIESMRGKYDYIICDSAPYILISDPLVMNDYVDATLYVVRCGVSDLRFIDEINYAAESRRLKNMAIVINDINVKGNLYGKYGSSYSYGYGYGYSAHPKKHKETDSN